MNFHVYTARNEKNAQPSAMYLICDVETESQAINQLYNSVQNGLQPMKYLGRHSIPDYTCGFHSN